MAAAAHESHLARNAGIGCLMAFLGLVSGGMIGVLAAWVVGLATGCNPPEGLPACNWERYAVVGWLVGAVTLPTLVLTRLRRSNAAADNSARG